MPPPSHAPHRFNNDRFNHNVSPAKRCRRHCSSVNCAVMATATWCDWPQVAADDVIRPLAVPVKKRLCISDTRGGRRCTHWRSSTWQICNDCVAAIARSNWRMSRTANIPTGFKQSHPLAPPKPNDRPRFIRNNDTERTIQMEIIFKVNHDANSAGLIPALRCSRAS